MSYDIRLVDPATGETIMLDEPHQLTGGTYAVGGTREAWLNVTYNYGGLYSKVIDKEKGIRALYGLTGEQAIPILVSAILTLGTKRSADYWEPTPGNAGAALADLLKLASLAPHGVFKGD